MTVNLIYLKDGYQHQYKREYYRKTKPTVKEMDASIDIVSLNQKVLRLRN